MKTNTHRQERGRKHDRKRRRKYVPHGRSRAEAVVQHTSPRLHRRFPTFGDSASGCCRRQQEEEEQERRHCCFTSNSRHPHLPTEATHPVIYSVDPKAVGICTQREGEREGRRVEPTYPRNSPPRTPNLQINSPPCNAVACLHAAAGAAALLGPNIKHLHAARVHGKRGCMHFARDLCVPCVWFQHDPTRGALDGCGDARQRGLFEASDAIPSRFQLAPGIVCNVRYGFF